MIDNTDYNYVAGLNLKRLFAWSYIEREKIVHRSFTFSPSYYFL